MQSNEKHNGKSATSRRRGKAKPANEAAGTASSAMVQVPSVSLVTGATGFVGRYLVRNLLESGDTVYILLRKESRDRAYEMIKSLRSEIPASRDRLHVVHGNVMNEGVANLEKDREILKDKLDYIWHLAGAGSITANRRQSLALNWRGTVNALKFASEVKGLKRFNYLSTVLVSGDYKGVWCEEMLKESQRFTDEYSRTKQMAEIEARRFSTSLPVAVFRSGVLIGDSKTGYIPNICGPYCLLRIIDSLRRKGLKRPLPIAPFSKKSLFNAVPVDFVANCMAMIGRMDGAEGRTYHLTDPDPMTIFDFFEAACDRLKVKGPKWAVPTQGVVDSVLSTPVVSFFMRKTGNWAGLPLETLSHAVEVKYDTSNASEALGGIKCPSPRDYMDVMMDFAGSRFGSARMN